MFVIYYRYQNSDTEYETPRGYHHPDSYYDDDEQPLYGDSRRSPKRRQLPATPQGIISLCSMLAPDAHLINYQPGEKSLESYVRLK